ncbi:hypothetical protein AALP_AA5G257500 [Arabis alpina]|uniref:Uncharacterized protein n=1 Tax=Arabis alpina TaxID=50452 RepID=A0A087GZD1_ARAAL|nr:hypothetical protein AALP_AA5G257500 [Arabis alpina]
MDDLCSNIIHFMFICLGSHKNFVRHESCYAYKPLFSYFFVCL